MRNTAKTISAATSIAALLGALAFSMPGISLVEGTSAVEEGKKLAFNRKKGNCLACHQIEGGSLPGNIGPPLLAMKSRFPDKSKLRAQIFDARINNSNTIMPPFGAHEIVSEAELDKIVEFIHAL